MKQLMLHKILLANLKENFLGKKNKNQLRFYFILYLRWSIQVHDLDEQLKILPKLSLLSAGFITYLASQSEDKRLDYINKWKQTLNVEEKFDVRKFLSTE